MTRAFLLCTAVSGALLVQTAFAQDSLATDERPDDGRLGAVTASLGYSSAEGAIGSLAFQLDRVFGTGRSLAFSATATSSRATFSGAFHVDDILTDTALDVTLRGNRSTPTARLRFGTEMLAAEARLTRRLGETTRISAYLGTARETVNQPQADLSPAIQPDVGTRRRGYAGLDAETRIDTGGTALEAVALGFGLEVSRTDSANTLTRSSAHVGFGGALGGGAVGWTLHLRGGHQQASSGATSIGDRFILGGGSIRGFAFGGFGPRDGTQPLGGNSYAVARLDVNFPKAFGEESHFVPGLHLDAGSLWGLSAPGAIDDAAHLRSSVGLTLGTRFGDVATVSLNLSRPLDQRPGDETETFQLNLQSKF